MEPSILCSLPAEILFYIVMDLAFGDIFSLILTNREFAAFFIPFLYNKLSIAHRENALDCHRGFTGCMWYSPNMTAFEVMRQLCVETHFMARMHPTKPRLTGVSILVWAATFGQTSTIQRIWDIMPSLKGLINSPISRNSILEPGQHGFTLLHMAARAGNVNVIEFLMSNGAEIYPCTEAGIPPFHYAKTGAAVSALALHGIPFSHPISPIPFIVAHSEPCALRALLDLGFDPRVLFSAEDNTSSLVALYRGDPVILNMIIKAGLNVTDPLNKYGWSLDYCIKVHNENASDLRKLIDILVGCGTPVNGNQGWPETPLIAACALAGRVHARPAIRALLHHGANINLAADYTFTPLLTIINAFDRDPSSSAEYADRLHALLCSSQGINIDRQAVDSCSLTALQSLVNMRVGKLGHDFEASRTRIRMVNMLLRHGFSIHDPVSPIARGNHSGSTILHLACMSGDAWLLEHLLGLGAGQYINEVNDDGNTPLMLLISREMSRGITHFVPVILPLKDLLLKAGADINITNADGRNA